MILIRNELQHPDKVDTFINSLMHDEVFQHKVNKFYVIMEKLPNAIIDIV